MSAAFHERIHVALSDLTLQRNIRTATERFAEKRQQAIESISAEEYQQLREQARDIKKHTLDNLDHYLEVLEARVREQGGEVIWCPDSSSAVEAVVSIARENGVKLAVKSKSMTSEEVHLNESLEEAGVEPVETDLGEYIQQLAGERPFHIVAPAMHKSRREIGALFAEKLGMEPTEEPAELTMMARRVLRQKFLDADMGISRRQFRDRGKRRGGADRKRRQHPADDVAAARARGAGGDRESCCRARWTWRCSSSCWGAAVRGSG